MGHLTLHFTDTEALAAAEEKFRCLDTAAEGDGVWSLNVVFKSHSLPLYEEWLKTATRDQIEFCDAAYAYAEEHYEVGGDEIVGAYAPDEVVEAFPTMDAVKNAIGFNDDDDWYQLEMFA